MEPDIDLVDNHCAIIGNNSEEMEQGDRHRLLLRMSPTRTMEERQGVVVVNQELQLANEILTYKDLRRYRRTAKLLNHSFQKQGPQPSPAGALNQIGLSDIAALAINVLAGTIKEIIQRMLPKTRTTLLQQSPSLSSPRRRLRQRRPSVRRQRLLRIRGP